VAVPLSVEPPTCWSCGPAERALLLLADDLDRLLGPGHPPIEVDRHLRGPSALTGEALAAPRVDLRAVNEGIGAVLDRGRHRGRPPVAAPC